jgi:hypothetical protein
MLSFVVGTIEDRDYGLDSYEIQRSLLEKPADVEAVQDATQILAADKTRRMDPFDGHKYYEGGWNLTDPHYVYVSFFNTSYYVISFYYLVISIFHHLDY